MTDTADLAGLLASRICHDLVSPVGAITNGADLIRELGGGDVADEISMISQSAGRAATLLQFYRVAFGAISDDEAMLARTAVQAGAERAIASNRVIVEWEGAAGPPLARAHGRLLYQILMCAKAVVGMRGRISVHLDPRPDVVMAVSMWPDAVAPNGGDLNRDMIRLLKAPPAPAETTARLVEFALFHRTAQGLGLRPDVQAQDHGVRVEMVAA